MGQLISSKAGSSRDAPTTPHTGDSTTTFSTHLQRKFQNFLLVWLDGNLNQTDSDFQHSMKALRCIVLSIDTFTDPKECINFLSSIKNEKIFMIVSGSMGQSVVPKIESLSQIESIYVFCRNKAANEQWAKKIPKVKGVYTKIEVLCDSLKTDIRDCDESMIPITFSNVNHQFMYTQLLKEVILQIKDDDEKSIKDFVHFCRQQNDINREQIEQIEREYHTRNPIWWYTAPTFMYSMLNRGFYEMDTDIIVNMQFFIRHLHQHIEEVYVDQRKVSSSSTKHEFKVYRGQGLSRDVFEQMKKATNGLMSFNNFLSTSLCRKTALKFADPETKKGEHKVAILFDITIDSTICEASSIPFANVREYGYYLDKEAEILFTTHTIFRIKKIRKLNDNKSDRLWEVQLTLISNNDHELNEPLKHLKQDAWGTGWARLGDILMTMDEHEKAEELYRELLARANRDRDKAAYLHQLGSVSIGMKKYSRAVMHFERSLEIYKRILPANDRQLAASYNNIGAAYSSMKEYPKALKSYQKSLEIQKVALRKNHLDLAVCYNNIGNVYIGTGDYSIALESFKKALEIMTVELPPYSLDLASTYNNMGTTYENLKNYRTALSNYEKALEIRRKSLTPDHPLLESVTKNIERVTRKIT